MNERKKQRRNSVTEERKVRDKKVICDRRKNEKWQKKKVKCDKRKTERNVWQMKEKSFESKKKERNKIKDELLIEWKKN